MEVIRGRQAILLLAGLAEATSAADAGEEADADVAVETDVGVCAGDGGVDVDDWRGSVRVARPLR